MPKEKPGRRCTWWAAGPGGTAVVKAYGSGRAPVAPRLDTLGNVVIQLQRR